ncbi:hypothetical protein KFE25_013949 [Diacronema lutheri]|uniref:Uncharacterized protein n=1 Tax=Diacronema lutheri TaxID=2081491 RepID=A0A8J6C9T5_DIALT|nr:hypothetical protein KFE25_013949 [Diacronema lutheri]
MADQLAARRARFAREAANPAPAPVRTMAWAGGKMTSNKDTALRKFLARKGDSLSEEQRAAARAAQTHATCAPPPNVLRTTAGNTLARPDATRATAPKPDPRDAKLRKKLGEIEALEARRAAGEPLEKNQLEKIGRKGELLAQMA